MITHCTMGLVIVSEVLCISVRVIFFSLLFFFGSSSRPAACRVSRNEHEQAFLGSTMINPLHNGHW
ncbi:hypothetical protein P280DRAFT_230561 [Massarina eburnea CBS 473.64]|uniref:Uncharacterized protein n=1 Tax=Massarina eburnea CBS 473.64 TaxID=1395130 RepID=A0A6A6SAV8_9PLEO|nr:hypothetical protein P280DRAFT_230561 [Massarina eburnea CBS 473.64]